MIEERWKIIPNKVQTKYPRASYVAIITERERTRARERKKKARAREGERGREREKASARASKRPHTCLRFQRRQRRRFHVLLLRRLLLGPLAGLGGCPSSCCATRANDNPSISTMPPGPIPIQAHSPKFEGLLKIPSFCRLSKDTKFLWAFQRYEVSVGFQKIRSFCGRTLWTCVCSWTRPKKGARDDRSIYFTPYKTYGGHDSSPGVARLKRDTRSKCMGA